MHRLKFYKPDIRGSRSDSYRIFIGRNISGAIATEKVQVLLFKKRYSLGETPSYRMFLLKSFRHCELKRRICAGVKQSILLVKPNENLIDGKIASSLRFPCNDEIALILPKFLASNFDKLISLVQKFVKVKITLLQQFVIIVWKN